MPESQTRSATDAADAFFDRYTLPKIALGIILAASLVGTWLTTTRAGHGTAILAVVKWAYLVALGIFTGGLVWKHSFVRPADLGDGAGDYCAEMYDRFDQIAVGALAVLGVGAVTVLGEYLAIFGWTPLVISLVAQLVALFTLGAATTCRCASVERQFRSRTGLAVLVLALSVVVTTALAEVAMQGFTFVAAAVRVLHLLAFGVWIGGAVWNIYVAVPTGQKRPTTAVVRAAGEQLERFRWAVRFIIPTLFLTGIYQAVDGFGTSIGTYLGSVVGLVVLAKVGLIGVLVVIFKLCPMWRACSPIEGVCELDNLNGGDPKGSRSADSGFTDDGSEASSDD